MSAAHLTSHGPGCFSLEGRLDFSTVARLAVCGGELLHAQTVVEIDLAGVTAANSAGLALLLEWLDMARARGARLTYRNLPDSLARLARVSNLESVLPLAPPRTA
ncbi:MAG: STAS domain-containing protein [Sphingobacteriia bacterium]|nr:STAS domain-containing protein [Sphingobacteriia bacterium]NCC38038.1 STAS domain-containing protein [Gammaproteobacteria bacterium]